MQPLWQGSSTTVDVACRAVMHKQGGVGEVACGCPWSSSKNFEAARCAPARGLEDSPTCDPAPDHITPPLVDARLRVHLLAPQHEGPRRVTVLSVWDPLELCKDPVWTTGVHSQRSQRGARALRMRNHLQQAPSPCIFLVPVFLFARPDTHAVDFTCGCVASGAMPDLDQDRDRPKTHYEIAFLDLKTHFLSRTAQPWWAVRCQTAFPSPHVFVSAFRSPTPII